MTIVREWNDAEPAFWRTSSNHLDLLGKPDGSLPDNCFTRLEELLLTATSSSKADLTGYEMKHGANVVRIYCADETRI